MGRTSKLTKTVQDDICTALSLMHTYESAAGYANIGNSTLSLWRTQGRAAREKQAKGEPLGRDEARKLKFLEAVEQAEAKAVFNLHQIVIEAAKVDARLALQMLQIRRPQDYAPPSRVDMTSAGKPLAALTQDFTQLSDDDLRRNLSTFARAAAELAAGFGAATDDGPRELEGPDPAAEGAGAAGDG